MHLLVLILKIIVLIYQFQNTNITKKANTHVVSAIHLVSLKPCIFRADINTPITIVLNIHYSPMWMMLSINIDRGKS